MANLIENFTVDIEYRIFCADEDLNGEPLTGIVKNQWTNYNTYTKVWYAEKKNVSTVICREIAYIKPDVLYIIGLFSWHFNIVPMLFSKAEKKIISVRGMLHPGALSQKRFKKMLFLAALKRFGVVKKCFFHATDDTEKQFIKNEFGLNIKTFTAGNFSKSINEQLPMQKSTGTLIMGTIALISPMKNHLYVLQALKYCDAFITYNIYGPVKDQAYWEKCKLLIAELPTNISVKYHGEIKPALVTEVLAAQHVFIMPSKSENFGHALAEALSAGRPVITSHNTPWNNLELNGAGINADADIKSIANAISFFAQLNQINYNSFVKAAKQYSIKNNNSSETAKAYKNMFFGEVYEA